jgi:hypothetical protein
MRTSSVVSGLCRSWPVVLLFALTVGATAWHSGLCWTHGVCLFVAWAAAWWSAAIAAEADLPWRYEDWRQQAGLDRRNEIWRPRIYRPDDDSRAG